MQKLVELLKDGHARTIEMLAEELQTSPADIRRQLEFLENIGAIRRVQNVQKGCTGCTGCEGGTGCKGCMPADAEVNMGVIWEVVEHAD